MENFVPIFILLMILGSIISEVRSQGKRSASPSKSKKKRTWMDYGRELVKQIESLDQDKSSNKPVSQVNTREKTQISRNDPVKPKPLREEWDVNTDSRRVQQNQSLNMADQNRVQKKVFLEEKRKPKVNSTLKKRLNKTGLRQSIIMAEVLGPPRSKQPYIPPKH